MTALMLLAPGTPMLFQGQEFGSTRPFLYFADHGGDLGASVRQGRGEFLEQFPSLAPIRRLKRRSAARRARDVRALQAGSARRRARRSWRLHRDLLALRRGDPAFAQQRADRMHGAVLGEQRARRCASAPSDRAGRGDRLLLVNLGTDLSTLADPRAAARAAARMPVAARLVQRGDRLRRPRRAGARHRRRAGCCRQSPRWSWHRERTR